MSARTEPPLVIEPYTPMSRSLEWRISDTYWQRQGSNAFRSGDVPHIGTTDGMLAARAADVFYQSCLEASERAVLEDEVEVVELGVGLGLFARLFLNRLEERCRETGADFYDRVRYFATDRSPKMVADLAASATLERHGSHVRLGQMDALHPGIFVDPADGEPVALADLRAVVHTYVLDTLPFEVLLHDAQGWMRMHVLTLAEQVEDLCARTGLDRAELTALVAAGVDGAMEVLLPVQDLLVLERAYLPVTPDDLPYGDCLDGVADAVRTESPTSVRFAWPFGAMDSVHATLDLLRPDGFLLFADYGRADWQPSFESHQRYGGSRARGVNLAGLEHVLSERNRDRTAPVRVRRPAGDEGARLHARLVLLDESPSTERAFVDRFACSQFDAVAQLREQALAAADQGALAEAREHYARAAALAESWLVMAEWSDFETNRNDDPVRGLELARRAEAMNPACHSIVLAVLGDALFAGGQIADALQAYQRGTKVQPDDVRCWLGKAHCLVEVGRFYEACCQLGAAFGADRADQHRPKIQACLESVLERRAAVRTRSQTVR